MRDFQAGGRSAVYADHGMCATSHPLAAQVAVETLKSGGNAIDAAIAGAVVLGLCEPQMTGIGGDCFALIQKPGEQAPHAINGSGRAPAAISAEALRAAGATSVERDTAAAITVPGAVDAFCHMSDRFGRLGLDRLLAPAIHYAEAGVPVAPRVAFDYAEASGNLSGVARRYYLKDDAPLAQGDRLTAPGQAEVLRRIARDGRAAFYEGEVAQDMLDALHAAGGVHTAEDFAATACDMPDPLSGRCGDATLWEHPPNGQGAVAILLTEILSHFDLASMDPLGADRAHIEAEATKLAYDARNRWLADPAAMEGMEPFLDPEIARRMAGQIRLDRATPAATIRAGAAHKDTIYITVVDRDRMAVSLIYSIFATFGSGIASEKFGILFHNRGSGFTLQPGHPNEIGPGKRPMHTIIPGILEVPGAWTMPFGVMGGQYQAAGHARFVTNTLTYGMQPQAAIDAPRTFAEGEVLRIERGYADSVVQSLADRGHRIEIPHGPIGGAQAIRIDHSRGLLEGGSDPRKDGCALGY